MAAAATPSPTPRHGPRPIERDAPPSLASRQSPADRPAAGPAFSACHAINHCPYSRAAPYSSNKRPNARSRSWPWAPHARGPGSESGHGHTTHCNRWHLGVSDNTPLISLLSARRPSSLRTAAPEADRERERERKSEPQRTPHAYRAPHTDVEDSETRTWTRM